MKTAKIIFFTLALSFLAASCKTETCGCPMQQKKYYKQYNEVPAATQAGQQNV